MPRPRDEDETLRLARERFAHWRPGEAEVTDIRLEGDHPDTALVIMFTHVDGPGCVFGFRMRLLDTSGEDRIGHADSAVTVIQENIDETIEAIGYGLPQDCRPGEVTWI